MVSFMLDSRVSFLIWFIVVAIVVAVVLIVLEVRMRSRRDRVAERMRLRGPVEKMRIFLKGKKSVEEKLEFIDKSAKEYFRDSYGFSVGLDYSALLVEFEKKGREEEAEFSRKMFEIYYSGKKLTLSMVESLGKLLIEADEKKKRRDKISEVPSFLDKFSLFVREKMRIVLDEVKDYKEKRKSDAAMLSRGAERAHREAKKWVLDALDRGYDRIGISKLLKDDKRSRGEHKKILKVYDSEFAKRDADRAYRMSEVKAKDGGVAERIVEKEKSRLDNESASSFGFF